MRIGIDFDNTLANYDGVFHAAAVERGLIPDDVDTSKSAVRDHLNGTGRRHAFTELQGYVYGARMDLVSLYPGAKDVIHGLVRAGHEPIIISHKTRVPIRGPAYDMHAAARAFLEAQGLVGTTMIPVERVYFLETKEEKVATAGRLAVDVFIDDLPEILMLEGFPAGCRKYLFDPDDTHVPPPGIQRMRDWQGIGRALLG